MMLLCRIFRLSGRAMLIGCGSITLASASLFRVKNPQYTADLEHRTPLAARSERRIGTMHTRTLFFFFFPLHLSQTPGTGRTQPCGCHGGGLEPGFAGPRKKGLLATARRADPRASSDTTRRADASHGAGCRDAGRLHGHSRDSWKQLDDDK